MVRCSEMLSLAGTVLQFSRLERVEVGGTKGKNISAAIKAVHSDFTSAHERFQQASSTVAVRGFSGQGWVPLLSRHLAPALLVHQATPVPATQVAYDVMDVDAPNYAADHGALRSAITGMEHRLGTLIMQVRWYPPMVTY